MTHVKTLRPSDYGRAMLRRLVDLMLGGSTRPTKALPEILFCPVIFANGRDDDTEGLRAFFENRPVMAGGEMVPAGDYDLKVDDLCMSVSSIWLQARGRVVGVLGAPAPGRPIATVDVGHGCHRIISARSIGVNCPVQP